MLIKYEKETDTLLIILQKNTPVIESEYIEEKGIVIDYDKDNNIVGFEIMGWSKIQKENKEIELMSA